MKWIIQKHKVGNNQQELKVSILVKEMDNNWAFDSQSFIESFKEKLKEIPRNNNFSAEFGYQATPRNLTSLEIWKMKVNGDFNYKMFTVTKGD